MKVVRGTKLVLGAGGMFLLVAGCDPAGASRAPATAVVKGTSAPTTLPSVQPPKATQLVMIVPGESNDTTRAWVQVVREQAGKRTVFLDVRQPAPGDPPSKEAELIREAPKRGASALIVVADD